jgi:hypothetical protein
LRVGGAGFLVELLCSHFFFLISNNFIEREKNQTSTQVVNLIEGKKKNRKIKDELNNVQSCQTRNLKNLNEKPLTSQEGSAGI